jgi:hypothetical protein
MGLNMTVEALLMIIGLCLFCCYFVFEYQRAATPPYQEPLEDKLERTELNPQATWPFPSGSKP